MLEDDGVSPFGALAPKAEPSAWETPEWWAEMEAKYPKGGRTKEMAITTNIAER
jgi:hypothetical protein